MSDRTKTLLAALAVVAISAAIVHSADAQAQQMMVAEGRDGGQIQLHLSAGPCQGVAREARFVAVGRPDVTGCWIADENRVAIVWLNVGIDMMARAAFAPPKIL